MKSSFSVDDVRLGEVTLRQQTKRNLVIFFKKELDFNVFFFELSNIKHHNIAGKGFLRFKHRCKFPGTNKAFAQENSSTPTGLVWYTKMATVSLFWNSNMAALTTGENALYVVHLNNLMGDNLWLKHSIPSNDHHIDNDEDDYDEDDDNGDTKIEKFCSFLHVFVQP